MADADAIPVLNRHSRESGNPERLALSGGRHLCHAASFGYGHGDSAFGNGGWRHAFGQGFASVLV